MIVKLLAEHLLEVLSLKGGCTCSSKSILVNMAHCWKSHAAAHYFDSKASANCVTEYQPATKRGILSVMVH